MTSTVVAPEVAPEGKDKTLSPQVERTEARVSRKTSPAASVTLSHTSKKFFSVSFYFALSLALLCLCASLAYLYFFLTGMNAGLQQVFEQSSNLPAGQLEALINGRLVLTRLSLLSCGVCVGIAFGFLGFALILLGVRESMVVDVQYDSYRAHFSRLSPGILLILAATVLIGFCVTRQTPFWYSVAEDDSGRARNTRVMDDEDTKAAEKPPETTGQGRQLPPRIQDPNP